MEALFDVIFVFCISSIFFINVFLLKQVCAIKSNLLDLNATQTSFKTQFDFYVRDSIRDRTALYEANIALQTTLNEIKAAQQASMPNKNANNWENISAAFARSGRGNDVRD